MIDYWNYNVAYYDWILDKINKDDTVLEVDCGDGYLVEKLAKRCKRVIGVEVDRDKVIIAKKRIEKINNAKIIEDSFDTVEIDSESIDVILFVGSIHNMDLEFSLKKVKRLLAPNGVIIVVGLYKTATIGDRLLNILRFIPAKIGAKLNNEIKGDYVKTIDEEPKLSLKEIRSIANNLLPGFKMRLGLYYRYILYWTK